MDNDKQPEANRPNALLGGVKTPQGKAVSKYNAQTHGILRHSLTDYEQEFYSEILEDLEKQYEPEGIIEQILIERIAINYLKLFRVQKAETEYIKSLLNPRMVRTATDSLMESLTGKDVVINEGYTPTIRGEAVDKLANTYARYETTIENRLFRALHELERTQKIRKGEKVLQALSVDVNQMGSFGETDTNL